MGLFNDARTGDYKELTATCQNALARHKKGRAAELASELTKLKQRFDEINGIDYFHSPAAHDAQMVLQRIEKALGPKTGATVQKLEPARFVGKTWLTRPRPGIDRAGSAWLIRKFIDPKARFMFAMEPAKYPDALPFD